MFMFLMYQLFILSEIVVLESLSKHDNDITNMSTEGKLLS
jgi:hypothetical protein